jgi:hypothetical protein
MLPVLKGKGLHAHLWIPSCARQRLTGRLVSASQNCPAYVSSYTTGLFTSPHLVSVRERIRINGIPIPEEDFVRFFYEVWDRLETNDTVSR